MHSITSPSTEHTLEDWLTTRQSECITTHEKYLYSTLVIENIIKKKKSPFTREYTHIRQTAHLNIRCKDMKTEVVMTHSFWATRMYFSDCLFTLSRSMRRKAWFTPAVETAHVALATVSCSPNVCLGNDIPGWVPMSSISTTALQRRGRRVQRIICVCALTLKFQTLNRST